MKLAAIICEFNPFHNGHKYLIEQARSNGTDCIAAIMSPNFVQRGECAVLNKYVRAQIAIENGVDIIFELPTPWAISSAQRFADAGVQIASLINTDELWFGSESGDINVLSKLADIVTEDKIKDICSEYIRKGNSSASALALAVESCYGNEFSDVLASPNNVLAIEYIKSIKKNKTNTKPKTVKRLYASHDSSDTSHGFASGSYIRKIMAMGNVDFMPQNAINRTEAEIDKGYAPASLVNGERAVISKLRVMKKEDFLNIPDVTEGLENRIYDAVKNGANLQEITDMVKTKRYTHARIRRIIMCAFLGITKDIQKLDVPYLRALMFNDRGAELLSKIHCSVPLIVSPAKALRGLENNARMVFELELLASNSWGIFTPKIYPTESDFKAFSRI